MEMELLAAQRDAEQRDAEQRAAEPRPALPPIRTPDMTIPADRRSRMGILERAIAEYADRTPPDTMSEWRTELAELRALDGLDPDDGN